MFLIIDTPQQVDASAFRSKKADAFFVLYQDFQRIQKKISILVGQNNQEKGHESLKAAWEVLYRVSDILSETQEGKRDITEEDASNRFIQQMPISSGREDIYRMMEELCQFEKDLLERSVMELDITFFQGKLEGTSEKKTSSKRGVSESKPEYIDKYSVFFDIVQKLGIDTSNWLMYEEKLEKKNVKRKWPYRIIFMQNPRQTWCISNEKGQAIFVYKGHPRIDEIVAAIKGKESSEGGCQKIEWRGDHVDEIQNMLEGNIIFDAQDSGLDYGVMKGDLLTCYSTQIDLIQAQDDLRLIGMDYQGSGEWDLTNLLGNTKWRKYEKRKIEIGGKGLQNLPSSTWNKRHGIGNEQGGLQNRDHVKQMLVSIGFQEDKIKMSQKDPFEWIPGMDEKEYIQKCRDELEKDETLRELSEIGIIYKNGVWNLENIRGFDIWTSHKIGGKSLQCFPSIVWSRYHGVEGGRGICQNLIDIKKMLVSLGYAEEAVKLPPEYSPKQNSKGEVINITRPKRIPKQKSPLKHESPKVESIGHQKKDPLRWVEGMSKEDYKKRCRAELEKDESLDQLAEIGMFYIGGGIWDLRYLENSSKWGSCRIGGKLIRFFPCVSWNKRYRKFQEDNNLSIDEDDATSSDGENHSWMHIVDVLISLGYKEKNILVSLELAA